MHFKGSGGPQRPVVGGDVQVDHVRQHAYATVHSVQLLPGSNPSALITCYDALGGAVNTSFSVQWLLDLPV